MCDFQGFPTCYGNFAYYENAQFCIDSYCESGYSFPEYYQFGYEELVYYCIDELNIEFLEDFISINNFNLSILSFFKS